MSTVFILITFIGLSETSCHHEISDFKTRLSRRMRSSQSQRVSGFISFSTLDQDLFCQSNEGHMPIQSLHPNLYQEGNPFHFRLAADKVPEVHSTKCKERVVPFSKDKKVVEEWIKGIALFFGSCDSGCDRVKKFYRDEYMNCNTFENLERTPFIRPAEIVGHIAKCGRKEWRGDLKRLFQVMARECVDIDFLIINVLTLRLSSDAQRNKDRAKKGVYGSQC
jgi:hypothetical protein